MGGVLRGHGGARRQSLATGENLDVYDVQRTIGGGPADIAGDVERDLNQPGVALAVEPPHPLVAGGDRAERGHRLPAAHLTVNTAAASTATASAVRW